METLNLFVIPTTSGQRYFGSMRARLVEMLTSASRLDVFVPSRRLSRESWLPLGVALGLERMSVVFVFER
jgi:hypothetical protein